jgi:peptidoglycan/LPS O-acetylase OafA/YrhL
MPVSLARDPETLQQRADRSAVFTPRTRVSMHRRRVAKTEGVRIIFQNGGNGFTVFFAISGFLITLTSLRRFGELGYIRAALFYRIRFARIAPLLLLVLTALSLLHWGSLHSNAFEAWHVKSSVGLPRALFSAVTFHLNWLEAKTGYLPANWDLMWSLSVEEMFYPFFPLVCLVLVGERSPLRRVGWPLLFLLTAALLVLGPWARSVWMVSSEIAQEKSYLGARSAAADPSGHVASCSSPPATARRMDP